METLMNMLIYAKSLRFSLKNSKKYDVGQLVNFMQVDSQKLRDLPFYLGGVIFLPLQLSLAIVLMYEVIGISFLAGLGMIFLSIVCNLILSKFLSDSQKALMEAKDKRMKKANEYISNIKLIKVSAWEVF
jgi:ABC-type multidrug transport system fused ATPase/permease subunit